MGVYEPLTNYLKSLGDDSWNTSFGEIERIIRRPLPKSAYDYRPWWGNQRGGHHSQSRAWREAGWETRDVDLKRRTVRFERAGRTERPVRATSGISARGETLWDRASALSGIGDREKLVEAALSALIRQETARYFAEIGGSMPEANAAPRERPFG